MVRVVSEYDDLTLTDLRDAFEQATLGLARIAHHDDVAGPRPPPRRQHEQPVALLEGRLHALTGDGHAPGPGHYFFEAQNMSLISLTAAWRSAAACAST